MNRNLVDLNRPVAKLYLTSVDGSPAPKSKTSFVYQIVPLIEHEQIVDEYGENCSQLDIIKYFKINQLGEIYLLNNSLNKLDRLSRQSNMICFLNVKVIDVLSTNGDQVKLNKELVFIIYNDLNLNLNLAATSDNFLLNDLIKLNFMKRINSIKNRFVLIGTGGQHLPSASNGDRNKSNDNLIFNYRNFLSLRKLFNASSSASASASMSGASLDSVGLIYRPYNVFIFTCILLLISIMCVIVLFKYYLFTNSVMSAIDNVVSATGHCEGKSSPQPPPPPPTTTTKKKLKSEMVDDAEKNQLDQSTHHSSSFWLEKLRVFYSRVIKMIQIKIGITVVNADRAIYEDKLATKLPPDEKSLQNNVRF